MVLHGKMINQTIFEHFDTILEIMIPAQIVFILSFYIFFECWLNIVSEITLFADRRFYDVTLNPFLISSWELIVLGAGRTGGIALI